MKSKFFKPVLLLLACLCMSYTFAQQEIVQSDTAKNGSVKFQRFDTSINPKLTANEKDVLKKTLKMTEKDSLKLEKTPRSA